MIYCNLVKRFLSRFYYRPTAQEAVMALVNWNEADQHEVIAACLHKTGAEATSDMSALNRLTITAGVFTDLLGNTSVDKFNRRLSQQKYCLQINAFRSMPSDQYLLVNAFRSMPSDQSLLVNVFRSLS